MSTTAPGRPVGTGLEPARPVVRRAPVLTALLVAGLVALVLLGLVSVGVGARHVPLADAWAALTSYDPASFDHEAVRARVPRTVLALVVGAALGLAGALMQGMTRNPLADPGILGVNAGASAAVVGAIMLLGITSPAGYVWFAFLGAGGAAAVVYAVAAAGREGATPLKRAHAGGGGGAALTTPNTPNLVGGPALLVTFRFWQVGSVGGRAFETFTPILPFLAAGGLVALACGRSLNALSLGDDVARGLGQDVRRARLVAGAGVVLLCGGATAAAGPIAFVGLTVPHVARAITGPDNRWVLPYSAVLGAALVIVSDVLGRVVAQPGQLQVGLVTALVGAPVFIALVRRRRLAEL